MVTRITPVATTRKTLRDQQETLQRTLLADAERAFTEQDHDVYTFTLPSASQVKHLAKSLQADGWHVTTYTWVDGGRVHVWRNEPGDAAETIKRFNREAATVAVNRIVIQDVPEWAGLAIIDGLWDAGYRARLVHDDETGFTDLGITWDQYRW